MQGSFEKLDKDIKATVIMLKGLGDMKEKQGTDKTDNECKSTNLSNLFLRYK